MCPKMISIDWMTWGRAAGTAVLLLAVRVATVGADEVHTAKRTYSGASIRHFDGEFVIFSNATGDAVARRLDEIEAIYVDSLERFEEFNRAERSYQQKRYRDAAEKYERCLVRTRGFWKDLVRVRHLRARDAAGDFDQAVEAFITIAQTMPDNAEAFMPSNLAGASAASHKRALQLLEDALSKVTDQTVYWQLEALRLMVLEGTESDLAGEVARDVIARLQRSGGPKSRYRLQIIAIRIEVKHGQYHTALSHINEAIQHADNAFLPELLFLKGKCLFESAQTRDDFIRAGLAAMRVVIHFPQSRFCAGSMYMAAQVHEKINRPTKAMELYEDCKQLPGATDELVRLAEIAVQRSQKR